MQKINEILNYLAKCTPYRPNRKEHPLLSVADKIHRWLLWPGLALFAIPVALAVWAKFHVTPNWLLHVAVWPLLISTVMVLLSPLILAVVEGIRVFRWKDESLQFMCKEIQNDERHVQLLVQQSDETLKYVQHHLKVKVNRIDGRIAQFFGNGAALFSVLAVAYTFGKDMGGVPWLISTFERGLTPGNYLNAVLLGGLALLVGLSLGAGTLKISQRRYAYQLDLVELALLSKSLAPEKSPPLIDHPKTSPRRGKPQLARPTT